MVGAEQLGSWVRHELSGYPSEVELPAFRKIYATIGANYFSGNSYARGATFSWTDLPAPARGDGPEEIELRGPLREIESLAAEKKFTRMQSARLEHAKLLWNRELGPFQQIEALYYNVSPACFEGVVDRARTALVGIVAELGVDPRFLTPEKQAKLADKSTVIQIFQGGAEVGDKYSLNVGENSGVIGQGASVHQSTSHVSYENFSEALRRARGEIELVQNEEDREDLMLAADDFEAAALEAPQDPATVERRGRQWRRVATQVGLATLTAAVEGAISAATS